ncbi:MAG: hypothetical protein MJ193_04340, partial [Clostridia bacterium]|nr:hypothetical protein [Clostridia bacterium]
KGTPDVIDNGYAESWNDSSIGKTINYDPEYIKNGDSSIKVSFSGYYVEYGTQYATLPGHLSTKENGIYDRDYFSIYKEQNVEEAWKDAVLYFWIYYAATPRGNDDMALDIGFFYGRHKENGEERITYEFGDTPITECAYGEWTQVAIRMKDLGQTSDLYLNVQDYYSSYAYDPEKNCDMITFKCRGRDTDYLGKDVKYTYTFYMDDIDITTYKDFKEKYPEYNWGVDYGATLDRKFSVENWKTSGKGISFEYELKNKDNPTSNIFNVFAHVDDGAGNDTWARLIENITLDFATNTATAGQIVSLGNDKYRYELMFDDCTPNLAPGEEPTGEETASSIYFVEYNNAMLISEFAVITEYSDK